MITKDTRLILHIDEKNFSQITDDNVRHKEYIISLMGILRIFDKDYTDLKGFSAQKTIAFNTNYIDHLFIIVPYLYQYYEISQRHFDLLDRAAINIENLYRGRISNLFTAPEKIAMELELSDYLNKIALIFQTAADKTENVERSKTYRVKAEEYSNKADAWRRVGHKEHLTKMQILYQEAATKYPIIRHLLLLRSEECRAKYEIEVSQHMVPDRRVVYSSITLAPVSGPLVITSYSPHFFAPQPSGAETQPLLIHRRVGDTTFAFDS